MTDREKKPPASVARAAGEAAAHTGVDVFLAVVGYFAGVFLTLLPQRYRRWLEARGGWHLTAAGMASGALQLLGCLAAIIGRYFIFRQQRMDQWIADTMAKGGEDLLTSSGAQHAAGVMTTLEYLTQPLTMVLLYFTFEGAVRLVAGVVTGEIVGTLPLQGVAWLHGKAEARWGERKLGPRVVDLVEEGDGSRYDLRISSCRPKKTWDRMLTIVHEDVFYELVSEERGEPARQFIYLLRRAPGSKVIRGHHYYRPEEPLLEK